MRYSVKYECTNKNWVVMDSSDHELVISTHRSKAAAYRRAFSEQERLRSMQPTANYVDQMRKAIPQTLVVG